MWKPLLLALMLASPAVADVKGANGKTIPCYCTDTQGSRVDLGETICLFVDGRAFMAQCQMSLNVPMWRDLKQSCVSSMLTPSDAEPELQFSQPAVQPLMDVPAL